MIPVVNHKHQYILFYSAKVACSTLRKLYLALHAEDRTAEQINQSGGYHNINRLWPYEPKNNYEGFTSLCVTRNPYSRIVSAYLDQYVYHLSQGAEHMLEQHPIDKQGDLSFNAFLDYLEMIPDESRDAHFQCQYQFIDGGSRGFNAVQQNKSKLSSLLNSHSDLKNLSTYLISQYEHIFEHDQDKLHQAKTLISQLKHVNSTHYSHHPMPTAAELTPEQIRALALPPRPHDFLRISETQNRIQRIYHDDFEQFNYSKSTVPQNTQTTLSRLLPNEFNWVEYAGLENDTSQERTKARLETIQDFLATTYNLRMPLSDIQTPPGFNYESYLSKNPDLSTAGLSSEADLISHYLSFGKKEGRLYV